MCPDIPKDLGNHNVYLIYQVDISVTYPVPISQMEHPTPHPPLREMSATELRRIQPKDRLWHEYGDETFAVEVIQVFKSSVKIEYLADETEAVLRKSSVSFMHGLLCEASESESSDDDQVRVQSTGKQKSERASRQASKRARERREASGQASKRARDLYQASKRASKQESKQASK